MIRRIALVCFMAFCVLAKGQVQLQWPPISNTTKPWTRWWWEGSAVNKADLTWNLEQYKQAGLGGVEITPIYGIYGQENKFINFLTPQWMEMLTHTLHEAKHLNLGVDLANGTGWPFGGPWVIDKDASKTIFYKTYSVNSGEKLKEQIIYNQEAMVRTANNKPASIDTILKPLYLNKNLQALALDQVKYPGQLPLQSLLAYGEDKQVLDVTGKVDKDGNLDWIAPAGKWTLYALFMGLHGKMVERAAPGGEGYAIDHFSATAANNYFKRFDEAFKGYDLSYLRGFFNDSYEVDDARGQANWTPGLFEEFKKRKQYDLKEFLPALFGKDNAEKNSRIIYDYRSVIDELILEDFTRQWKKWADGKGKIVRNQSHGSPANTLDLYSVVDIPETEGDDILRFKFATSAANVTGKKLVSSESATWLNEHFISSWADVKKAIDLFFLGGVNHIFYHGTAYSPKEAPWPGWLFYAAVHFQPVNPQWKDFHVLNEYITRVQSFLQSGQADNDVLLYYPIVDRYSQPGNELLQHFDGMEKNFEHTDFEHVSKWMLEHGYSFDFFSDRQLQQFTMKNKSIVSGGNNYQVILLPANKYIPLESMQKLIELANNGATIIFYKDLPAGVPGYYNLDQRTRQYNQLVAGLSFKTVDNIRTMNTPVGGVIASGNEIDQLLRLQNIRQEKLVDKGLQYVRRKHGDTTFYFILNSSKQSFDDWIPVDGNYKTVLLFDAMSKATGAAASRIRNDNTTNVRLQLKAGESIIMKAIRPVVKAKPFIYYKQGASPIEISGNWAINFLDGGPVLPSKMVIEKLGSWTELKGDSVKNFSGTASYSTRFKKPINKATNYLLDLGVVNETAEIKLNGKKLVTLIGPTFQTIIPASALQQTNTIEIIVANLMANRIAYMDRNKLPWKIFYNTNMPARKSENSRNGLFSAADWKPLPSGLLGPVSLTPLTNE